MKIITTIILLCSGIYCNAQEVSVEKSVFGIQTGLLGVWIHNESKLNNEFVLRSELGFDSGIWYSDFLDEEVSYLMTPVLTLEPRFYYNLNKRNSKSKIVTNNNGNFISLKTSYHPDWFVISNKEVSILSDISIIPTWGLRRNLGTHFSFETGLGIGYSYLLTKDSESTDRSGVAANIHLRIGYIF